MDTDVLVVGAGPTGLMLANQLARRNIRVLIIDRHPGPSLQTRALGVQARTLEIYAHLGIVERALELGKRGTGANMWAQGRKMARVPLGEAGQNVTPYPYILILGQDDNERIMGDRLRELGLSVQWNTELVGLAQDGLYLAGRKVVEDVAQEHNVELLGAEVYRQYIAGLVPHLPRDTHCLGNVGRDFQHLWTVVRRHTSVRVCLSKHETLDTGTASDIQNMGTGQGFCVHANCLPPRSGSLGKLRP